MNQHTTVRAARRTLGARISIHSIISADVCYGSILIGILLLSGVLNLFHLDRQSRANAYNLYYAAAVKSMLGGWHNFWFAAFDPSGFVTVDKPPVGFWIQAASTRLLDWSGLSLLLPEALAGIASVALLAHLINRVFGRVPALLAALTLTLTPIFVATNRNNTIDSLLLLTLLGAAWAASLAAETGNPRMLTLSAALVGLGFNIKMLQAYLVVPAFVLLYLLTAPVPWKRRLIHLSIAAAVLLGVSLVWAASVDLTPASQRPFVGGSGNNTVWHLIIGHNGAYRVLSNPLRRLVEPAAAAGSAPGAHITDEIGLPGPFRLFNQQLAGQTSWLLPLIVLGAIAAWRTSTFQSKRARQALLLWALWLLPQLALFSIANKFHRYYLVMLTPAIAALAGVGLFALWQQFRTARWSGWLLPLALGATAAVEAIILASYPAWSHVLVPLVTGLSLAGVVVLVAERLWRQRITLRWARAAAILAGAALFIAPAAWAITPLWGADAQYPFAGPDVLDQPSNENRVPDMGPLVRFLEEQRHGERFLAATLTARTAAPLILLTDQPVMDLGGYSGSDHILTPQQLAARVQGGEVRFFLLPQSRPSNDPLAGWVTDHCRPVASEQWSGRTDTSTFGDLVGGPQEMFDCGR